jgi:hypothetical protein
MGAARFEERTFARASNIDQKQAGAAVYAGIITAPYRRSIGD